MRRADALRQYGFWPARGLVSTCKLGQVVYRITAEQDAQTNKMCGGSPEVYLTVTRDGAPVLRHVVFGYSCNDLPSVQRITFGDGPAIMRDPEATVCFLKKDSLVDKTFCDFFQKKTGDFKKNFPIDQADVEHRAERYFKVLAPSPAPSPAR
jgi:hypothetical protein